MKKIITVLAALAVTTVAAFAGPAISVGGGFGADIEQQLETFDTAAEMGLQQI